MKLIINWIINAAILYGSASLGLIQLDSFSSAMLLALVAAIITWGIKLLTVPLKAFGCFTFGITLVLGMVLSVFAVPLALYYAQNFVDGYKVTSTFNLVIIAILMSVINGFVGGKKEQR